MGDTIQESIICDHCGKKIKYNPIHFTKKKNGEPFNLCDNCVKDIVNITILSEQGSRIYRSEGLFGIFDHIEEDVVFNVDENTKPINIKEELDRWVVGQERAKRVLATAVYNHIKRIKLSEMSEEPLDKSNILLIGPTGSGKTYLVKTLAKMLDVPLYICDATSFTEAGYVGDDVESIITNLVTAANGDVKQAEKGIVFIDEIDKLAFNGSSNTSGREVGTRGVQQALLKLIEGTTINPKGGSGNSAISGIISPYSSVNTKNILFICGGAFPDVENIIKKRKSVKGSMGFGSVLSKEHEIDTTNILLDVQHEDLVEFGMIPEFLGRLPIIAPLEDIDVDMLRRIMTEPKNSITSQYIRLMKADGIDLKFDDDALTLIAERAYKRGTGARSLRSVLEDVLLDVMYELPSSGKKEYTVTRKSLESTDSLRIPQL